MKSKVRSVILLICCVLTVANLIAVIWATELEMPRETRFSKYLSFEGPYWQFTDQEYWADPSEWPQEDDLDETGDFIEVVEDAITITPHRGKVRYAIYDGKKYYPNEEGSVVLDAMLGQHNLEIVVSHGLRTSKSSLALEGFGK